jgi:hypothetical protein
MNTNQVILNLCHTLLMFISREEKYFYAENGCNAIILDEEDDIYNDLLLVLLNNGCKLSDNMTVIKATVDTRDNAVDLIFIDNSAANDANSFFDYVEINDMKALVIFLDYFSNIHREGDPEPEDEVTKHFIEQFGNSEYYDALKRICDIYLSLISNPILHMNMLGATAAANMYRWDSSIIAAYVIDKIKPITDADISDMDISIARRYLTNLELRLKGIRLLPGEKTE